MSKFLKASAKAASIVRVEGRQFNAACVNNDKDVFACLGHLVALALSVVTAPLVVLVELCR